MDTPWLICCSIIVLPVRGGATIKARCPLPSGVSRSMTRVVSGSAPVSSFSHCSGLMGVSWSNVLTFTYSSGLIPSTSVISRSRGPVCFRACWTMPWIISPGRRPYFSIMVPGTNGSVRSRE